MEHPEWISRAKPVDNVRVEIGFLVSETFYFGPEDDVSAEQWKRLREPLYRPEIELYGDFVLSSSLGHSASELIRYYRDVLRLAAHHRKSRESLASYFWMRPLIFAGDQFDIRFPWSDTWPEANSVLDALAAPGNGELLHDLEQGWEFHAFADAEQLFLRAGVLETREEHFVIATNRSPVVGQIAELRARVSRSMNELIAALGQDYWSHRW